MRIRPFPGVPRPVIAAAVMLALLAVAAVATGRGDTASSAPPGSAALGTAGHHVAIVTAVVLIPILAVLGFVLFMYAQIQRRRERDKRTRKQIRDSRRRTAAVFALLLGLAAYYVRTGHSPLAFLHLRNPFALAHPTHGRTPHIQTPHGGGGSISGADWTVAVLVWAALLAAAVFVYLRVRARRHALEPFVLSEPLDESAGPDIDALRRERSPRRAVIAAYAMMERQLARDGIARGPHEAPMEYLGRVTLNGHPRIATVHRLTALYQRARFSHRPVSEEMRRGAIAAVEELTPVAVEPE